MFARAHFGKATKRLHRDGRLGAPGLAAAICAAVSVRYGYELPWEHAHCISSQKRVLWAGERDAEHRQQYQLTSRVGHALPPAYGSTNQPTIAIFSCFRQLTERDCGIRVEPE